MRGHLDLVRGHTVLIIYHSVMHRVNVPLQTSVRLEVEIEIKHACYAFIDDSARTGVTVLVGKLRVSREEFGMVPFSRNESWSTA